MLKYKILFFCLFSLFLLFHSQIVYANDDESKDSPPTCKEAFKNHERKELFSEFSDFKPSTSESDLIQKKDNVAPLTIREISFKDLLKGKRSHLANLKNLTEKLPISLTLKPPNEELSKKLEQQEEPQEPVTNSGSLLLNTLASSIVYANELAADELDAYEEPEVLFFLEGNNLILLFRQEPQESVTDFDDLLSNTDNEFQLFVTDFDDLKSKILDENADKDLLLIRNKDGNLFLLFFYF